MYQDEERNHMNAFELIPNIFNIYIMIDVMNAVGERKKEEHPQS